MIKGGKAFAAGYGCAVAGLARDHREDQLAAYLLRDSGMALSAFVDAGMDDYDLDVIKALYREDAAGGGGK